MCRTHFFTLKALSVFLFLLSSQVFVYSAESVPDLTSAKDEVCNLMNSGRFSEAAVLVDKFIADNPGHPDLPDTLFYSIAEKCRWSDKYEEEKNLYQQIIQNYPNSSYASKARLGFSRAQIQCLILAKDYSRAKEAFDKLVVDFSGHPDLPDALYWIAERYRWAHRWQEASGLYQQIAQNHPDSPYAARASLGLARAEVLSLIVAQDYSRAKRAFDKLVTDFSGHPDLPETLYQIAEGYRWADKYETAKSIYQQIIQNHHGNPYAVRASLGFARAEVLSLIVAQDYSRAKKAFDKLVAVFSEHPDLPDTLYNIARRWVYSGDYLTARDVFQRVIQHYPTSPYADKAKEDLQIIIRGLDIFSLIESGQAQAAQEAMGQLVTDFKNHELLPHTMFTCGDKYFTKACQERDKGLQSEATEDFKRALDVWKKLVQLPNSAATVEGYYHLAGCYHQLGEYERAIEHYTKVVDGYPNYRLVWDAQFMIGHTYEKMLKAGLISESAAKPLISAAYKKVLEEYPDCAAAKAAQSWLNRN